MPESIMTPNLFKPPNLTDALSHWNYTYYHTNRTLSNSSSDCYLAFAPYIPLIFDNGTFANATSCFAPINPLQTRGILALVFGSLFATTILFTLINLRKHGKVYLPRDRSFKAIGRRWQWYWMLFVAACGCASCFTGVDVDRDYVLGLPMSLQCFFLTLMNPGLNAVVWEYVRHCGSWEQRRLADAQPFAFSNGDLRSKVEFYVPLVFYLLDWLLLFMTIPRSWTKVQLQRSPQQALTIAAPSATDLRFKAGGILSAGCFVVICFSMLHSKKHYNPPLWKRSIMPGIILTLACHTGYWVASAWRWDLNPFNLETDLGFQYSLNYGTALSILIQLNVWGYLHDNEDRTLTAERMARGHDVDAQLAAQYGKPSWWSHRSESRAGRDIEMRTFAQPASPARSRQEDEAGSWWWQGRKDKSEDSEDRTNIVDSEMEIYRAKGSSMLDPKGNGPPLRRRSSQTQSELSGTSGYSTFNVKPQAVRSMLDV